MISDNGEVSSVLGTVFSPRLVHVLCQKLQIPKSSQAPAAMGPYIFTFFKFFFFFWNSFFKFITIKIYYTIIQSLNQTHSYKKSILKKKNPLLLINTCYKRDSQVCKIRTNVHKPNWVLTTNSLVGGFGPTTIWLRMDGIWHVYFCHNAWIIWVYLTLFC